MSHGEDRAYGLIFRMGAATAPALVSLLLGCLRLADPEDCAAATSELVAQAQMPTGAASDWCSAHVGMLRGQAGSKSESEGHLEARGAAAIQQMRQLEQANMVAVLLRDEARTAAEPAVTRSGQEPQLKRPRPELAQLREVGTLAKKFAP